MIEYPTCQVCEQRPGIGVASSRLGPISVSFCRECLEHNAEPLWAIHITFECIGGPENIREEFKELCSWKDGKYIEWDEILALYHPDHGDES